MDGGFLACDHLLGLLLGPAPSGTGLLSEQPLESQMAKGIYKFLEADGFADITVGPEAVAAEDVLHFPGGSDDDDGQVLCPAVSADAPQDLKPVHTWQPQVEQYQRREIARVASTAGTCGKQKVECRHSVAHHFHIVPDLNFPQAADDEDFVIGIVFHQQYEFAVHNFLGLGFKRLAPWRVASDAMDSKHD